MARTPRFGLAYFGGGIEGSLSANGGKFTRADRLILDRLLSALEVHDHGGGERLGDPTGAPGATLQEGAGTLPGGVTYYYATTYIDQFGLETAVSDEVSVVMPGKIGIPPAPGVNAISGGTLDEGTHLYGVTAHDAAGGETPISSYTSITITDFKTVEVTPVMPTGADSVSIWRQGPYDAGPTRLVTQASAATFTDDGSIPAEECPTDPGKSPPTTNTTGSSGAVTITAPTGDLVQPTLAKRWRIYRTTSSGAFDPESLLVEISTTEENSTQLVTEYIDDGSTPLSSGQPPLSSSTMTPSAVVTGGGGGSGATVILRSSGGVLWRLTATRSGNIETRSFPVPTGTEAFFADEGIGLYDSGSILWRVTVSDAGQITTTSVASLTDEVDYLYGQGPELATVDGAVAYRLGVDADGALVTYGQDDSTVVEGVGVRRFIVSDTEPTSPKEGDVWIDIS